MCWLQGEKSDFSWAMWKHLIICLIALLAAVTVVPWRKNNWILVGACASGSFRQKNRTLAVTVVLLEGEKSEFSCSMQ
jgi:hypothetical protein